MEFMATRQQAGSRRGRLDFGEVAEWLKATAPYGAVMRETASEVRILPLSAKFDGGLARHCKMKLAYLLFAYKNPKLIKRLVEYLSCEDASFFVHIDQKVAIEQFDAIRGPNIFYTDKRIPVYWAEFSGVEAILLLIRAALAAPQRHDYFVLLSGSEFPLRSREYIHRFFEQNRGQEFITMKKMPAPGKPISRLNTLRFPSTRPLLRFTFRALAKFGLAQRDYRKAFGQLEPYSGLTWWTLSREACEYVNEFTKKDRRLTEFCKNIHAPEETYIHTIIGNSPFGPRCRRNLVYEEWPLTGPQAHPEIINERHLELFASQNEVTVQDLNGPGELLFARKFSDNELPLVEKLSAIVARKEKLPAPAAA